MNQSNEEQMLNLVKKIKVVTGEDGKHTVMLPSSGKEIQIFECRGRNIHIVVDLFMKVSKTVDIKVLSMTTMNSGLPKNLMSLFQSLMTHIDSVFDAVSTLSSLTKEDIEDLLLDDLVVAVISVTRVNALFFFQRILPMLEGMVEESGGQSELPNPEEKKQQQNPALAKAIKQEISQ